VSQQAVPSGRRTIQFSSQSRPRCMAAGSHKTHGPANPRLCLPSIYYMSESGLSLVSSCLYIYIYMLSIIWSQRTSQPTNQIIHQPTNQPNSTPNQPNRATVTQPFFVVFSFFYFASHFLSFVVRYRDSVSFATISPSFLL
jgi:hypothetical protein